MLGTLIPALVSGGIGLLGSAISGRASANAQAQANRQNLALAREQMAWQENMWQKENDYNSPAAQMKRIQEAGLNPALMYSQGNVGNAGSVGSYSNPNIEPVNPASGVGQAVSALGSIPMQYLQLKMMEAQVNKVNAESRLISNTTPTVDQFGAFYNNRALLYGQQRDYYDARAAGETMRNMYIPGTLGAQQRYTQMRSTKVNFDMQMDMANMALQVLKYNNTLRLTDAQIEHLRASAKNIAQRTKMLKGLEPWQLSSAIGDAAYKLANGQIAMKDLDYYLYNQVLRGVSVAGQFVPKMRLNLNNNP